MKIWDRGRLAEFGIDIRGGWIHCRAGNLAVWIENNFDVYDKPFLDSKGRRRAGLTRMGRVAAYLSCFCEACIRAMLPWPFNW